jgi:hypothetical protein
MLLHLLTAANGTFETSTNVRCTAAFGDDPDATGRLSKNSGDSAIAGSSGVPAFHKRL